MGKAGRWLRSMLTGRKKDGGGVRGARERKALPQPQGDATPLPLGTSVPREKKRWSFRRPSSAAQGKPAPAPSPLSSQEQKMNLSASGRVVDDSQSERAVEVAVAAADAAVMAAAQAAAAVAQLKMEEAEEESDVMARWVVEEAAAARIQATFRGYLARKALCALRGLVKLQALIRGQLVRRQANATLRRMQALVAAAQSRLQQQAQRARAKLDHHHLDHPQRRSPQHPRRRSSYDVMDRCGEDDVGVVEMDGEVENQARRGRSSCSAVAGESRDRRLAAEYYQYQFVQCSPAPSSAALGGDLVSPRTYSGHLDDLLPYDPTVPSYMANTESSRAKARSQSAPRQRGAPDALERQPSTRRRGNGVPPGRKTMQRSVSHVGVPACGYQYQMFQYPAWAGVRLDRSSASLVGSECGSTTSSVLTAGYSRSLVGFEQVQRSHY